MIMRRLLVVLLAALALPACVLHERFRYVQRQDDCFVPPSDPVPGAPNERRPFQSIDCRTALYTVGFIEFDQAGDHVDPAQAQKVLRLIQSEKQRVSGAKIITLVYVHGWKNNADPALPGGKAKDVERFMRALSELGYRARQVSPANPVPVVGVYIGWKGKSLKGPGLVTWLSYWGRRNTANRVGGETLTSVLNDIIETTVPGETDTSRVMLVGHSFGARVLERAIDNGVTLYDPEKARAAVPVRPRVDLVLYVNAANDSRLSMRRVEQWRANPITVRHPDFDPARCPPDASPAATSTPQLIDPVCKSYALVVAITSKGDLATKYLQPIANRLNLDRSSAPTPTPPSGTFLDPTPSIGRLRRSAPGHLRFMHSHDVTELACPEAPPEPVRCDPLDASCAFAFRTRGDDVACFKASVRLGIPARDGAPAMHVYNDTAFWIMGVDARVVKDHGDIWNLSMLNLLGELMVPRGFFDPAASPMQIRSGK